MRTEVTQQPRWACGPLQSMKSRNSSVGGTSGPASAKTSDGDRSEVDNPRVARNLNSIEHDPCKPGLRLAPGDGDQVNSRRNRSSRCVDRAAPDEDAPSNVASFSARRPS